MYQQTYDFVINTFAEAFCHVMKTINPRLGTNLLKLQNKSEIIIKGAIVEYLFKDLNKISPEVLTSILINDFTSELKGAFCREFAAAYKTLGQDRKPIAINPVADFIHCLYAVNLKTASTNNVILTEEKISLTEEKNITYRGKFISR